jgi:hypothetical protein
MATHRSCPRPKGVTTTAATAVHRVLMVAQVRPALAAVALVVTVPLVQMQRPLLAPPLRLLAWLPTARKARPSSAFVAPHQQLRPLVRPKENNDAATRTSQVPQGTKRP